MRDAKSAERKERPSSATCWTRPKLMVVSIRICEKNCLENDKYWLHIECRLYAETVVIFTPCTDLVAALRLMLIPYIKVKGSASFWCHTSHACFKSDFKIDCSVDQLNWRYNSSIIPLIFSILVKCCSFEPSYPVLEEENVIQFKTLIKASEMLVAPRISKCFGLL